jgi:shikimate kinase
MGVGKTTVGKKLANSLELPFVDTDALFTSKHGSIADFFSSHEEAVFREIEETLLVEALSAGGVIATGGGVVLSQSNREQLKRATVIYLKTDGTHMAKRLSQGNRPLLKNGFDDWNQIYNARKALYEAVADHVIDCSGQPIRQTVDEIREVLSR